MRLGRLVTGRDLVYQVPTKILRRLYEDMAFARTEKVDERGRHRDFHAFRHTAARRLILAGANPKYIQKLMRHEDIKLTFDLYGDLEVGEVLDANPVEVPPIGAIRNATQMPPKQLTNEAQ